MIAPLTTNYMQRKPHYLTKYIFLDILIFLLICGGVMWCNGMEVPFVIGIIILVVAGFILFPPSKTYSKKKRSNEDGDIFDFGYGGD